MKLIFLDDAESEFVAAVLYYETIQPGLGIKLRDEVSQNISWIKEHADSPRLRSGNYYRVNLRVFPHYIAYIIREETIWIVAVAHAYRKPGYWIDRISK